MDGSEGEDKILEKLQQIEAKVDAQHKRLRSLEERVFQSVETPVAKEIPPAPPPPLEQKAVATAKIEKPVQEKDWESILGGNWMVKIGIAAVTLGVGFFLKLAFDNDWIGPTGRIILGIAGGFVLIGLGEYWKKKYAHYAQILTGGGIIILYVTIYAAHTLYQLFGPFPAFGFMILVTVTSGLLAIRYNQATVAVIGILGGFITPFLFVKTVDEATLIIYTLILDIGILAISAIRNWRPLNLIGLVGSYALFASWYQIYYTAERLWLAEGFLTTLFLIFALATVLWHFAWNRRAEPADLTLMTVNAAGYFVISYLLLFKLYGDWMGFFAFALSGFYALLAYAGLIRANRDFHLTLFLGGISLVFLTIAMPIQLDGNWITIAWAVEGGVLVLLGFLLRSFALRAGGLVVLLFGIIRLFMFDAGISRSSEFTLFFNERFFTFFVVIVMVLLSAYFYKNWKAQVEERDRNMLSTLLLAGNFLILWILSAEAISYFDAKIQALRAVANVPGDILSQPRKFDYTAVRNLEHAKNFSLSAIWAVYSILLIILGIFKRVRVLRLAGLVLFWVVILKVFIVDVFGIGGIFRVASLMSLGVILLVTGYLYQRYRSRIKEFLGERQGDDNTPSPPVPPSL